MGIKVDSISFQNFYNYHGGYEENRYEFNDGLNLIVADNGAGKSKLFNGFLWVLDNEVLDSESKKKRKVGVSKFQMISDKAKNEAEVDQEIITGVKVEYSDSRNNYQIIKEIRSIKRDEENPIDENGWETRLSDTQVNIKSTLHQDFKPEYDKDKKDRIINNLLRTEFRDYALLQGEEVDNIIDLTKSDSLGRAIDSLSNIKDVEDLGELSEYLVGRAEKDLDKKRKEVTENTSNHEELVKERDKLREEIKKLEDDINRDSAHLTKAENEKEDILNTLATSEERQTLRRELDNLESDLNRIEKRHNVLHEDINDFFFDDRYAWILLGSEGYIKDFAEKRNAYLEVREEKRAEQRVQQNPEKYIKYLPADIPDISSLNSMLEKEVCFVCGSDAKKGSDEWNHIKKVSSRTGDVSQTKKLFKNNLSRFFDDLQTNTRALQPRMKSILESVKKKREEEQSLIEQKKTLSEKISLKKNELFGKGGDKTDSDEDVNNIQKFGNIERRIEQYENSIEAKTREKGKKESELENKKKEIGQYDGDSVPSEFKKNHEVLDDLNNAIQNTRERIIGRMIDSLETESNKHFVNLTKHSGIKGPKLKFTRTPDNTVRLKVEDSQGNIVTGESEGFQRMKKLAVIMAIITSSSKGMMNYPFIADAPISAFGKAFIRGFFEQVPEVFNQSIILVKDLYDNTTDSKLTDFGQELFENKVPSTLYINEVEIGKEQIERDTKISRYI